MKARSHAKKLLTLAAYVLLVLIVIGLVIRARQWAIEKLATQEARDNWQTWREDVRRQQDPQAETVARRVPKSTEPPGLVLLRDYFATCIVAAVVFASLLYAVIAWLLLGATAITPEVADQRQP